MGEMVYRIEAVRERALKLLRERREAVHMGEIARALGMPLWAVEPAMESAYLAKLAVFKEGEGWRVLP